MKSILTRVSGPESTEIMVLPPAGSRVPPQFRNVISSGKVYRSILSQIQIFRGEVYLEDDAISRHELSPDGRHILAIDDQSWHVVAVEKSGEISGCLRFLEESTASRFDDLWLHRAAVVNCPSLGPKVRLAVEQEMARARRERLRFGEVGGWAISKHRRCSWEALRIVLSTYGLLQLLGGCIGMATATVRHGSADILRKIGLTRLHAGESPVSAYYDPQYGCLMEMLKFDSRHANSRFVDWIDQLASHLTTASVITTGAFLYPTPTLSPVPAGPIPAMAHSAVA